MAVVSSFSGFEISTYLEHLYIHTRKDAQLIT